MEPWPVRSVVNGRGRSCVVRAHAVRQYGLMVTKLGGERATRAVKLR